MEHWVIIIPELEEHHYRVGNADKCCIDVGSDFEHADTSSHTGYQDDYWLLDPKHRRKPFICPAELIPVDIVRMLNMEIESTNKSEIHGRDHCHQDEVEEDVSIILRLAMVL